MAESSLSVEIKGLEELQRKFDMSDERVKQEAGKAMTKAAAVVWDRAGTYPPAPASSSYVRTGTLGRTFARRVETYRGGVKGFVDNPTPYARYVRGEEQAAVHAGRWLTMKQIVEQKMGQIEGFFRKAMRNLAGFLGD